MDAAALADLTKGTSDEVRASAARLDHVLSRNGGFGVLFVLGSFLVGSQFPLLWDALAGRGGLAWLGLGALLAAAGMGGMILARNAPLAAWGIGTASLVLLIPFTYAASLELPAEQRTLLTSFIIGLVPVGGVFLIRHGRVLRKESTFLATAAPQVLAAVLGQRASRANRRKALLAALLTLAVLSGLTMAALRWWAPPDLAPRFGAFTEAWRRGDAAGVASFLPEDERAEMRSSLTRLARTSGWGAEWPAPSEPRWTSSRFQQSVDDGPMITKTIYVAECSVGADRLATTWECRGRRWEVTGLYLPALPVAATLRDFVAAWNARDGTRLAEFAGPPDDRAALDRALLSEPDLPAITSFQARELEQRQTAEVVFLSHDRRVTTLWVASPDGTWRLADTKWLEEG